MMTGVLHIIELENPKDVEPIELIVKADYHSNWAISISCASHWLSRIIDLQKDFRFMWKRYSENLDIFCKYVDGTADTDPADFELAPIRERLAKYGDAVIITRQ